MNVNIDHIGIAVRALVERLPFWSEALGLELGGVESVQAEGVRVAFLRAGSSRIELLEPEHAESPVAKFIDRRGEGIHHLTLGVSDLTGLLDRLRARGVPILGDAPRPGAEGRSVAFLHPKAAGGVLVELVQTASVTTSEIGAGAVVLVYLREPNEKLWGMLRRLDASGVLLEGVELGSFDDWVVQIEREEESVIGPSLLFLPMGRVEKIMLDRTTGHLPSLADRFERRTGRTLAEVLGD